MNVSGGVGGAGGISQTVVLFYAKLVTDWGLTGPIKVPADSNQHPGSRDAPVRAAAKTDLF